MSAPKTPAVPDPTVEALIAEVLGEHVSWTDAAAGCMGCDWKPDNADYAGVKHRAHVAAVLAPLLAARAAAPDALRVRIEALAADANAVRLVGEAIEDAALIHLGRDVGTIHRDDIARAAIDALRALLEDGAQ